MDHLHTSHRLLLLLLFLFFPRGVFIQFFFHRQSRACGEANRRTIALPLPRLSSTSVKLESTAPLMAVVPEMRLNTSSASSFRRWWISRMAMPWVSAMCFSAERSR